KSQAFESYESWFFDNEAYLQKADGTRFAQNGGTTLTGTADGRIDLQYRFVDPPGKMSDYKLIYQSPSNIVEEAVSFALKDRELPAVTRRFVLRSEAGHAERRLRGPRRCWSRGKARKNGARIKCDYHDSRRDV